MKRVLAVLCAGFLLAGCGTKNAPETAEQVLKPVETPVKEEPEEEETEAEEAKKSFQELFSVESDGIDYLSVEGLEVPEGTVITLIGKDAGSAFWKTVKAGAEKAVADLNAALGYGKGAKVKLSYDAPSGDDTAEQIDIIDQMLDKSPDAMIVGFVDVSLGRTQIELAEANGIPMLAVDSGIENDLIVNTTRTDNRAAGAEAARKLAEAMGETGQAALLVHSSVTETGIEREAGFREELEANHPAIELVDVAYIQQDERSVNEIVAETLAEYPDLKAYFGANEDVTRALVTALEKETQEGRELLAAGFDACEGQVKSLEEGKLVGVMTQNPYGMGYASAVAAFRAVLGLPNASLVNTGYCWLTAENLSEEQNEYLCY